MIRQPPDLLLSDVTKCRYTSSRSSDRTIFKLTRILCKAPEEIGSVACAFCTKMRNMSFLVEVREAIKPRYSIYELFISRLLLSFRVREHGNKLDATNFACKGK